MRKLMIAAAVVFVLVILGVGVLWYQARGMVSRTNDLLAEAESFGRNSSDAGCFEEARRRYLDCTSAICELMQTPFTANCMRAAGRTEEFCAGVASPAAGDGGEAWRSQVCLQLGGESKRCDSLLEAVQEHCY